MNWKTCIALSLLAMPLWPQETVPLYRVTVVQRDVDAVNYQYRSGPTKVDFRGTVLMPKAEGDATVESRRGGTEISASFKKVDAPRRFGREYLTYVLWAITPEGSPHNLGEVVTNSSDSASLRVTTELQAFGMIVTAEPYATVRQPSDVVVLQNVVRPDTVGQLKPIHAKYELMPRGHYTLNVDSTAPPNDTPKVSMKEYEAISNVYQAQNAVNIARAANAGALAPNTMAEAERLLMEAQRLRELHADTALVVQSARAASQTAEDARTIAERRAAEQKIADARSTAAKAEQERDAALAEANAARQRADAERAARVQAEATAAAAVATAGAPAAVAPPEGAAADRMVVNPPAAVTSDVQMEKGRTRTRLLESLNGLLVTRDTPRGLVVTLTDDGFSGGELRPASAERLARVAAALATTPGLRIEVEGNSDAAAGDAIALARANGVARVLQSSGLNGITARGLGSSRLLTSNASEAGRVMNRRVEIVISGDAIGTLPYWDRTYRIK